MVDVLQRAVGSIQILQKKLGKQTEKARKAKAGKVSERRKEHLALLLEHGRQTKDGLRISGSRLAKVEKDIMGKYDCSKRTVQRDREWFKKGGDSVYFD
jgi:hypothetical protein